MPTYTIERWEDCQPEIAQLCVLHWEEIALNRDSIPLAPDWERYEALANLGMVETAVARDEDGQLVGYQVYFVMPHMHYKTSLTAMSDVLFLAKEHRKGMTGIRLMKCAEQRLKERGVQRVIQNVKLHSDWGLILERLQYKPFERLYAKLLG